MTVITQLLPAIEWKGIQKAQHRLSVQLWSINEGTVISEDDEKVQSLL